MKKFKNKRDKERKKERKERDGNGRIEKIAE